MNRDIYHYNDYELLYLAHSCVDEAFEILSWKYSFLIKSRIRQFHIPASSVDDFYQEGLMILREAIDIYSPDGAMKFTSFFDLLLKRRILNVLKKEFPFYTVIKKEEFEEVMDQSTPLYNRIFDRNDVYEASKKCQFSELETIIFKMLFLEYYRPEEICQILNISAKGCSNAKHRIIRKLKHNIYK